MAKRFVTGEGKNLAEIFLLALVHLKHLSWALRLVWAAAPKLTLAWAVLLVLIGLLPASTVYLLGVFVDSLVTTIQAGGSWETLQPTIILAALVGITFLLSELLSLARDFVSAAQAEYVQDYIKAIVHDKSIAVDMAFYETPEYYDHLHRAQGDASNRPLSVLRNAGTLVQNIITLLAMGAILIPYGLGLPLMLVTSTLPALAVVIYFNRRRHTWWEETTTDRRWAQYYDSVITGQASAAELRLFNLGSHFKECYLDKRYGLRDDHLKLLRDESLAKLGATLIGFLVVGLATAWMAYRAINGTETLGDVTKFFQAFFYGQSLIRTLLNNVGQIYSNSLYLGNLFEFLSLEAKIKTPVKPEPVPTSLKHGITFKDISFEYPGSDRQAIENFYLHVPAGKVIAIVGTNGAGKSTLVRLLCRFYDPQVGQIELDGINIRHISVEALRRQITVLFQTPVLYQMTAGKNIALGDFDSKSTTAQLQTAAAAAGAHEVIMRLPQRYRTQLGKWFANGTDLSGGEWQRIALARAFYREAQIVILDEPTSAMDSWAETEWLARFRKLVEGQTAIIITHRFTTAMQADIIHVMDQGQIIESGTHAELMALAGRYAESWRAQMRAGEYSAEQTEGVSRNGQSPKMAMPSQKLNK